MEKLILQEQDLINAVCLFHAKFKQTQPENVEVELCYDDEVGYTAEAYYNGAMDEYKQAHFITAIRLYIDCLLYTSPSPRDRTRSRMPSSA